MKTKKYFTELTLLLLFLTLCASNSFAQPLKSAAPREEKLLNGLKLLIWNQPNAEKTSIKIRVHNGAAFDPQGKEGAMALLGEILFPNETIKEFFREDLGGSLTVTSNYDYIQIEATADADSDKFLTLLETLSRAVTNPQIDKETTALVRAAQIEKVKELEKNPSYVADRTVAKRLFGDFPYGRATLGTVESLQKIDFADLILAKQKFLTPDNATVAIVGNVKPELAIRAAKRYFGSWVKADKKVPATFTQPNPPDTKTFLTKTDVAAASELRYSFRGLARSDKNYFAAQILSKVLQNRLMSEKLQNGAVRFDAHFLPGVVVFELPKWNIGSVQVSGNTISLPMDFYTFVADLMKTDVKTTEFEKARNDFSNEYDKQNPVDAWLDADTFKSASVKDAAQNQKIVSLPDVQRVLEGWRKEPVAISLVVTAAQ